MEHGTQRASAQQAEILERLIHSHSEQDLRSAAENPGLSGDLALALLTRRDLPASVLQDLAKNTAVLKNRTVLVALVGHPKTPRFVSLPLSRSLFPFELMQVAMQPAVPADLKITLEQMLLDKVATLSLGERLTLAKLGPTKIAERLLLDVEPRVIESALLNPHLTEACVVRTLMRDGVDLKMVERIVEHPKWSMRVDVRCALLRNPKTPMAVALQLAQTLPADVARDALYNSNLPPSVKAYLMAEIQHRQR